LDITVLDISQTAIDANRKRLTELSNRVSGLLETSHESTFNPQPTMYGTIEQSSISSPHRLTVPLMFAKLHRL
jgi:hypothetical protein